MILKLYIKSREESCKACQYFEERRANTAPIEYCSPSRSIYRPCICKTCFMGM